MHLTEAQKTILATISHLGKATRQDLLGAIKNLSTPAIDNNLRTLKQSGILNAKKERQQRTQHDERHLALVTVYSVNQQKVTF